MIFIGVDPGNSGSFTFYSNEGINLYDMPTDKITLTTKTKKGNKRKQTVINLSEVYKIFDKELPLDKVEKKCFAMLEQVTSSPQQGVKSAFNFGYVYGVCEAVLVYFGVPYELVRPNVWKKTFSLAKRGKNQDKEKKEDARLCALRMFPHLSDQLKRKKDHNRADSLLLAEYARRVYNSES